MNAKQFPLAWTPGLIRPNKERHLVVGGSNIGLFAPFSILEPHRPATENTMVDLVSGLNRDDALLMCALLNGITSGSGYTDNLKRQITAYRHVPNKPDGDRIDAWIKENSSHDRVALFFRGQLLELMRWISRYSSRGIGDGRSFQMPETCSIFLRAAFLASELWSQRIYADKLKGGEDQADALDRALGAFRKGVEEAGSALHIGVAIARGRCLFEDFFPKRLLSFRTDFERATGLTIEEYVVCTSMLMLKALDAPSDGYFFQASYARMTTFRDRFDRYVAAEAQTPDELAHGLWKDFEKVGFRAIRDRPILRTEGGQLALLDPTFFLDHLTVSPLFKVLTVHRNNKEVFSAFGRAFEDYMLSILSRMYEFSGKLLVQRLYPNVHSGAYRPEFEIDALINEGKDLVVMEAKAAFIPEKVLVSATPAAFLKELRKKYAITGDPDDRNVGVAQLARCIRAIVNDKWAGADIDYRLLGTIYPVMLVHDERMGSPGMGAFLERIFRDLLGQVDSKIRVAPLTLMTIHDLENQESSHEFSLVELLAAYVAASAGGMTSLHNFMALDSRFCSKIRPNEALIEKSIKTVELMRDKLFPTN